MSRTTACTASMCCGSVGELSASALAQGEKPKSKPVRGRQPIDVQPIDVQPIDVRGEGMVLIYTCRAGKGPTDAKKAKRAWRPSHQRDISAAMRCRRTEECHGGAWEVDADDPPPQYQREQRRE